MKRATLVTVVDQRQAALRSLVGHDGAAERHQHAVGRGVVGAEGRAAAADDTRPAGAVSVA